MSRKRTNNAESSIDQPSASVISITRINGSSSHCRRGRAPSTKVNTATAKKFTQRLKPAVSTTAKGIARRGNWILRTKLSRSTTQRTEPAVASAKKLNITTPLSSIAG